jgi:ABC-type sugar transport system substrate-binding protein
MIRQWKDQSSRIALDFTSISMGDDLCVVIAGGDAPHLGAVAVAQARPSLQDESRLSATTSVIALLGHKDDEIARLVAHALAAKLNKNVAVCCGIHIDRITRDELDSIDRAVNEYCQSYPQESA